MNFDAILTLSQHGKVFANPRRIALLKAINDTGSISQGAKQAGISYKAAFDAIKDMNSRAEQPLIESEKGGKGGGGASLTTQGLRIVQVYELLSSIQTMGLQALNDESAPLHSLLGVMSQFSLQTSARNQLFGTIIAIENHTLHDQIMIQLQDGAQLIATITHSSTLRLKLAIGKDVVALIKGPAIEIASQPPRPSDNDETNVLKGCITSIQADKNSVEINLRLNEHDEISALFDKQRYALTELHPGKEAYAIFPAAQVIIATLC